MVRWLHCCDPSAARGLLDAIINETPDLTTTAVELLKTEPSLPAFEEPLVVTAMRRSAEIFNFLHYPA